MDDLQVEGLDVHFGARRVLEGLTLPPLRGGELTVLAGPNAAGKSTLLRAIAQLQPHTGTVSLGGRPLAALSLTERARIVGFMPQTLPSTSSLTVLEAVLTAIKAADRAIAHPEDRALAVLERLGIADLGFEPLSRLSGGQRQMAALAQAIVRNPALLLLDEPTSALDLARQFRLLSMVKTLASEGRVVVAVLHDLALAAQWADRIIVLHEGRLFASGPPATVLTPELLAEVYKVHARVETCSRGRIQILVDEVV